MNYKVLIILLSFLFFSCEKNSIENLEKPSKVEAHQMWSWYDMDIKLEPVNAGDKIKISWNSDYQGGIGSYYFLIKRSTKGVGLQNFEILKTVYDNHTGDRYTFTDDTYSKPDSSSGNDIIYMVEQRDAAGAIKEYQFVYTTGVMPFDFPPEF